MGAMLSCLDPPEQAASRPLLEKQNGGGSGSGGNNGGGGGRVGGGNGGDDVVASSRPARMEPKIAAASLPVQKLPPKFIASKRAASKRATEASASRTNSGIFCRCGGPGSLIQLVPCKCHSLCLICAQAESACPDCGVLIEDSIPSWKVAK